jgi:vancomycin resistance protein YoaR
MEDKIIIEKEELAQRVFAKDNLQKIMQEDGWKIVEEAFGKTKDKLKQELVDNKFKDISDVIAIQKAIKKIDELWQAITDVIDEGEEAIKALDDKCEKY